MIRTEREIVADLRTGETDPTVNPNVAAYIALRQAASMGLDAGQTSATITEMVLRAVWDNARHMYDGSDITHDHPAGEDNGGCNACILEDIATMLNRPHWRSEINANRA